MVNLFVVVFSKKVTDLTYFFVDSSALASLFNEFDLHNAPNMVLMVVLSFTLFFVFLYTAWVLENYLKGDQFQSTKRKVYCLFTAFLISYTLNTLLHILSLVVVEYMIC